jgi:hypothetical protein
MIKRNHGREQTDAQIEAQAAAARFSTEPCGAVDFRRAAAELAVVTAHGGGSQ